jgi:ryanodine receptor 2
VTPDAIEPYIKKGDVIGCALDLTVPVITFTFNGHTVKGSFRNFNLDGMFFPVISCSSKLRYNAVTMCSGTLSCHLFVSDV